MKIAVFFPWWDSYIWTNRGMDSSMIQSLSRAIYFLFAWSADRLELGNRFASWKKCVADSQERRGSKFYCSCYFYMSGKCPWMARGPDSLKQMPQRDLPFVPFGVFVLDWWCSSHSLILHEVNLAWGQGMSPYGAWVGTTRVTMVASQYNLWAEMRRPSSTL